MTLGFYSTDAPPPSFSSTSSTTPPPLYSPSKSNNDGPIEGVSPQDEKYDLEEDPASILEDSPHSRLGTAKVEWVLPSTQSIWQDGQHYQEPSLD